MKCLTVNFSKSTKGFSLLEVLIASVVIVGTVLGSAKLQTESMRLSQSSRSDVIAMHMAQQLMDNISISKQSNNYWNFSATNPPTSPFLINWLEKLQADIPQAEASIDCSDTTLFCTINIGWQTQAGSQRNTQYVVSNSQT